MLQMKQDKHMGCGNIDFQYSDTVICCKWYDNKVFLLLASNAEGRKGSSTVLCRIKDSTTKTLVACPNFVNF